MTRHLSPLVMLLILALTPPLVGCDSTANLTEQEHIQRAKDFEDKGNLRGSIVELKNAIQKNPDSPQARLLLGQVYLKSGSGAEAEKELVRAQQLGISRESIAPLLGEALLLMGEHQRLLDEIQSDDKLSTINQARILALRANAMLAQGKLREACDLFNSAQAIDSSHPSTYWGLAMCAIVDRNPSQARTLLDEALKLPQQQSQTWVFIGDLEQLNGSDQAALNAYDSALKLDPENLQARYNRVPTLLRTGKTDDAAKEVALLNKRAPNLVHTHYLAALLAYSQRQYPESRDALQQAFKFMPDHPPSLMLAAMTSHALGSYQQAETYVGRFLARFPSNKQGLKVLAATQLRLKQPDKALDTLAPLLASDPKDAQALALAGEASLMRSDPNRAISFLASAAVLDPGNAALQTQLSLGHLAAGNTQLGLSGLQAASAQDATQADADLLLVRAYLSRKEFDQALTAIDALEKKQPGLPQPHQLRGTTLLGQGKFEAARRSFERALAIDPLYFPAANGLAELDMRDNKPEAARQRFERILAKDKTHLQAMLALAQWAKINQQDKAYQDWLDKAARAHPGAIEPRAELVSELLAKGEKQKALVLANEVVNTHPEDPVALNVLGNVQMALLDYSGALSTFAKLVRMAPQSADAHMRLAFAQIASKRKADARTTLQTVLKLKPDHIQAQDALLRFAVEDSRLDEAMHIARQLQTQHPGSPIGHEREGDVLILQKNPGAAQKAYEQALAKGAGSAGFIKVHRALILSGNPTAQQRLDSWITQHPKDNVVRLYAAEHFTQTGRPQLAITAYQDMLRQTPGSALLLNNLASLYQQVGDKRALATAEQAHKLAPANPAVLDTLGWVLVEQGQVKRGLDFLQQAHAKAPKIPEIRYHLAAARARNGDKARARQELQQLLQDEPDFSLASSARALLNTLKPN